MNPVNESLKGVIFDLDGTLAETHPMAIRLIGESISRSGGGEMSGMQVMALFGRNERGVFRLALGDEWEPAWDFYLENYVDRHQVCSQPFPGIPEILLALSQRGIRLGLVTAKTVTTGTLSLEVLGLDGYFDEVSGGGMDGVTKRDDIARMISLWELDPNTVVYIGDTASDVEEAKAAGAGSIAAAWSDFADVDALHAARPDQLFVTVDDLGKWIDTPH